MHKKCVHLYPSHRRMKLSKKTVVLTFLRWVVTIIVTVQIARYMKYNASFISFFGLGLVELPPESSCNMNFVTYAIGIRKNWCFYVCVCMICNAMKYLYCMHNITPYHQQHPWWNKFFCLLYNKVNWISLLNVVYIGIVLNKI